MVPVLLLVCVSCTSDPVRLYKQLSFWSSCSKGNLENMVSQQLFSSVLDVRETVLREAPRCGEQRVVYRGAYWRAESCTVIKIREEFISGLNNRYVAWEGKMTHIQPPHFKLPSAWKVPFRASPISSAKPRTNTFLHSAQLTSRNGRTGRSLGSMPG